MPLPDRNLLDAASSPYLVQHKDNPVHWREWGSAALAEAQETGKPILLSVGYAACHWCHVMAHESFEDPTVAKVMNRLFVNIKVDREERPDIDQIYMAALHALGQQGGWPLTMFLTPDGGPVWGGTYFPREARWGRPGFAQVLEEVARVFREEPGRAASNRAALIAAIDKRARAGATLDRRLLDTAAERLSGMMDLERGGTSGAPKFPQASLLELFWRASHRTGQGVYRDIVLTSLSAMCQGGIYDHVGGGFARYATDAEWLVPHFEKMLYDNAQLIDLLTWAWSATGIELFRTRIEETIGWLSREMRRPEGGFSSSLDADSEGHEGRFYVWSAAEIDEVLGTGAPAFKAAYGIVDGGNWEGTNILARSHAPEPWPDDMERAFTEGRAKLLNRRAGRVRPGLDDKVLADWNGLAITALARASAVFERQDWLDLATGAYRFVCQSMSRGDRLGHSWRDGRLIFPGLSSDYAAMIRAAVALHLATGEPSYLADARRWAEAVELHHADPQGGYWLTADDAEALVLRPKSGLDEATPGPNGILAEVLVRLWILTGDDSYRARADRTLMALSGDIVANAFGTASLLNALDTRLAPTEVILVGPAESLSGELARTALRAADPRVVVLRMMSGQDLPSDHPAHGRTAVDGRVTAYVCRAQACSLPVTDPAALANLLAGRGNEPGG